MVEAKIVVVKNYVVEVLLCMCVCWRGRLQRGIGKAVEEADARATAWGIVRGAARDIIHREC